jgi:uncharacterized membrane protein
VEFVWEVLLGCEITKFWVFFLVLEPQYSYQKWHQVCSTVKFAEQNSRFLPFLGGICMGGTLRMSSFKILRTRCINCILDTKPTSLIFHMWQVKNNGFALFTVYKNTSEEKFRFEVLFKKFHPKINLSTLFLTLTYLLYTIAGRWQKIVPTTPTCSSFRAGKLEFWISELFASTWCLLYSDF